MAKSAKGVTDVCLVVLLLVSVIINSTFLSSLTNSKLSFDLSESKTVRLYWPWRRKSMKSSVYHSMANFMSGIIGKTFKSSFKVWSNVYRLSYYDRKFVEERLSLDDSLVKEYFPVSFVVPAVLEIYQNLLGVKFVPVKAELWHPGKIFLVWSSHSWVFTTSLQRRNCFLCGRLMQRTKVVSLVIAI